MGLFSRGNTMLNRSMKAVDGQVVTYTRDAGKPTEASFAFEAWTGSQIFAVSAPAGEARVVRGDMDWLFAVADAVAAGLALPPLQGDRVTATLNGVECVFEASTPTGETVWRYEGNPGTVRLHTRQVA